MYGFLHASAVPMAVNQNKELNADTSYGLPFKIIGIEKEVKRMASSSNVELLYRHPNVVLYIEDNTEQSDATTTDSDTGLYGIQVGAFESGRDGVVLRYSNTAQMLEELGSPDYEKYGQAGYNAYNALESKSCGVYILRVSDNEAKYASKVMMARFKVRTPKKFDEEVIDHVDTSAEMVADKNLFTDMGSSALGSFSFYGEVPTGITGDNEIDGMFGHITPEWLNDHTNLPKFTFAVIRFSVPDDVTVGENIKITQISKALKNFYADFNEDPTNIVANGNTATKTKTYSADGLLQGTNQFDLVFIVQENDSVSISIEWGDDAHSVSDYTFSSANVTFTDVIASVSEGDAADEEPVEEEITGLEIQYYGLTLEAQTEEELLAKFSALYNEDIDEDGYYNMPFGLFYAKGKGSYGNDLRIRITDATDVELAYNFHRYMITVMQNTKTGLKNKEYIRGSINENAWDDTSLSNNEPAYLQDLINDMEIGSQKISAQFVQPTLELMLELYNTEIADGDAVEELTLDTFDPLFGLSMTTEAIPTIIRTSFNGDTTKYEDINPESLTGFALESGSDGKMTYKKRMTTEEKAAYDSAYETALLRAFQDVTYENEDGSIVTLPMYDKLLKSRYSTPADFIFDANFSDVVKVAMAEFSNKREYDCMCYLDSGLNTTISGCAAWLRGMKNVYGFNVVKDIGCYKYRDPFTRKVIPCTMTHFISKALPAHLMIPGIDKAFARSYATLKSGTDFIAGSFYPMIDPDDHETKKIFDTYSANCYEALNRNTIQRASAITTCKNTKVDRSDEFNEYILNRAVRIAYEIMNSNIYNVIDEESVLAYAEHAKKQIEYKLNGLVRNVSIDMTSDKVDKKKSILRLVMHIEFNTVCKYGVINVILDPRGTADAAEEEELLGGAIA